MTRKEQEAVSNEQLSVAWQLTVVVPRGKECGELMTMPPAEQTMEAMQDNGQGDDEVGLKLTDAVQRPGSVFTVIGPGQEIVGGVSAAQRCRVEALLRGVGAAAAKSEELISVSVQPLPARISAVVALGAGALFAKVAPSRQSAVVP